MFNKPYTLDDLLELMSRLRDPEDGCPWDKAQNFDSIVQHTIEESYELADAIAQGDFKQIKEELGDVLFQVVFYSQLGTEQGQFDFDAVVDAITAKLLRRHPHVFPEGTLQSRAGQQTTETPEVKKAWEAIKAEERKDKSQHGILDDVPVSLPALSRASKLQKRAARAGFDWEHTDDILTKLKEELAELEEARQQQDEAAIHHEMGDILFCCVNLARRLQVDSESALRGCNQRFEKRFRYIEQQLASSGRSPEDASLEEMDKLWDQAKQSGL
jgi:ATP diphosphatase